MLLAEMGGWVGSKSNRNGIDMDRFRYQQKQMTGRPHRPTQQHATQIQTKTHKHTHARTTQTALNTLAPHTHTRASYSLYPCCILPLLPLPPPSLPMSSYNPLDPFGIGVSMSVTGLDASAAANYTPSFALRSDPAIRRKKVALIVSWLEEHRGATAEAANKSFEEVLAAAKLEHIDQNARNEIYKDLKANPKILITDAEHMQYKATHTGLFNITDLQQYIARFTHGLPAEELNDAYQGVKEDIEVGTLERIAPNAGLV